MNTPETARVEVTPELLERVRASALAASVPFHLDPRPAQEHADANVAFTFAATPNVVFALVERIRELESLEAVRTQHVERGEANLRRVIEALHDPDDDKEISLEEEIELWKMVDFNTLGEESE